MAGEWITIATFSQPVEAHLARTRLESEGITCVVSDEYLVRVNWLLSDAVGGVKLRVPSWDAPRAREILRPKPRLVVVADAAVDPHTASDEDMICPRCRSFDVYYTRFSRRAAGLFMLVFGFILPWLDRRWLCKQCGYEWKGKVNPRNREGR
jgi:rubredoxin